MAISERGEHRGTRKRGSRGEKMRASGARLVFTRIHPEAQLIEPLLDKSQKSIGKMRECGKISPRGLSRRINHRQQEVLLAQAELIEESISFPPISPITGRAVRYGK